METLLACWHTAARWHISVSLNWVIMGLDNGLSPVQHQTITWTNYDIQSIWNLRTNFTREILIHKYWIFHLEECIWKCCLQKWCPFCSGPIIVFNVHSYLTGVPRVSLKLSCGGTCQARIWFQESNTYFHKIRHIPNEKLINKTWVLPCLVWRYP